MNAVLPVRYTYFKNSAENINDEILELYRNLPPEKNTIIDGWKTLGVPIESSLESQAYLFHYKNYCQPKRCLDCAIGLKLLQIKPGLT